MKKCMPRFEIEYDGLEVWEIVREPSGRVIVKNVAADEQETVLKELLTNWVDGVERQLLVTAPRPVKKAGQ